MNKTEGDKLGQFDGGWKIDKTIRQTPAGRFPANIIFDEIAGVMLDEMSGESKSSVFKSKTTTGKRDNTYNQDLFD